MRLTIHLPASLSVWGIAALSMLTCRGVTATRGLRMRGLMDFDWDFDLKENYPILDFDGETDIEFQYNFTGTLGADDSYVKYLKFALLEYSCDPTKTVDPAVISLIEGSDQSLDRIVQASNPDEDPSAVELLMDINRTTITESPYYTDGVDGLTATIQFCLRGDYMYDQDADAGTVDESIDFHEVQVTVNVDLTAGFNLTAISLIRNGADEASANLVCEVRAYFCTAKDRQEISSPFYSQGELMTFCVETAPASASNLFVRDIMETDLDQVNTVDIYRGGDDAFDDLITNFEADPFTVKSCIGGICQVTTQLKTKYFRDRVPNDLVIFGTAVCALGPAPPGETGIDIPLSNRTDIEKTGGSGEERELFPTTSPTYVTDLPTRQPYNAPNFSPTSAAPTLAPSQSPSTPLSLQPSSEPSNAPTERCLPDLYPLCPEGTTLEGITTCCDRNGVCTDETASCPSGYLMDIHGCCVEASCTNGSLCPGGTQCLEDGEIGVYCFDCHCGFCDGAYDGEPLDQLHSCCEQNANGVNCKPNSYADSEECKMQKGMFPSFLSSNGQVCSGNEKDLFLAKQTSCGCKPSDTLPCTYSPEDNADPCTVCNTQQLLGEASGTQGICAGCLDCMIGLESYGAQFQLCLADAIALGDDRLSVEDARECLSGLGKKAHDAFAQCNDACYRGFSPV